MTLTNYWWLLIWMFTGAAFLAIFVPKRQEMVLGKKETRWTPFAAMLMALPYIVWAGFRGDGFGDTGAYRATVRTAPDSLAQLGEYLSTIDKDKGFSVLVVLFKTLVNNSDKFFFLLVAAFQMACLIHLYRKYSCNYWFSIFVFVATTDYMSWMHNGLRQFIAVSIILASTDWIIQKKYLRVILMILLASTFHASALLMIPALFIIQGKAWNKKTIIALGLSLVAIVMVDQFTNVLDTLLADTQYSNMVTDWQEWNDDGTNPIRVLVYSVPTILSVVGLKWIRREDNPIINMSVNASICGTGLYIISMVTSGIFIGRLPIYFTLWASGVLLPWEIKNFFTRDSQKIVWIASVAAYSLFYVYQMHFAWGIM